jgi:hypothetical protein
LSLASNLFRIWSNNKIIPNVAIAQTMMINLDNQYLNTNHVPKYEINVIVIIQYIRTFVNVWKYLSIGLFSSYRFFSIQIATNANPEISANSIVSL